MGDGIRGITLRYSHEIRDAANYFSDVPKLKLPDEMLRIAEHIVETKTSEFDPAFLEDRYRTVLIEKLKKKQADVPRKVVVAKPSAENVINLMDVLKRSLEAELPARRAAATGRRHIGEQRRRKALLPKELTRGLGKSAEAWSSGCGGRHPVTLYAMELASAADPQGCLRPKKEV
jgi:hypothetical protein